MAKMTTEEAFVKVLQMHGIEHAFGIIGSAFMPISDIFPDAGITFWDVAHETNGGLIADGYTRATGKMSMVIAQNGPGITGLVTPIKTAYWNHTPLLLVTPQAGNKTILPVTTFIVFFSFIKVLVASFSSPIETTRLPLSAVKFPGTFMYMLPLSQPSVWI